MPTHALITGGSGYFGSELASAAHAAGMQVRIFDLNPPDATAFDGIDIDYVAGDIRDRDAIRAACQGIDTVYHNVAQVPLAKDVELFESVNVTGTANLLIAAREAGVTKVVHTSTSAIYGIPEHNPVTETTRPTPVEDYGRAKLVGERLCADAVASGLDVTIVRPRTIMGHGRLGIMAMLFELIAAGAPIPLLGDGSNRYQFVHAADLASACLAAGARPGATSYNIGATTFGTLRETLGELIDHAGTGSRIQSLPMGAARLAMKGASLAHLVPLAPYHWLLYGESLYFDCTKAQTELGWAATRSNAEMMIESYDWFCANRDSLDTGGSVHQSPARLGVLKVLEYLP
ncbi:MAG: NAD-dependent epimerase/dehydratase family protein [Actinobacteria bacterium]|nr:NAD-dependent epimerase/dehydratase family protein [Actinomycetota bacterium]